MFGIPVKLFIKEIQLSLLASVWLFLKCFFPKIPVLIWSCFVTCASLKYSSSTYSQQRFLHRQSYAHGYLQSKNVFPQIVLSFPVK